MFPTPREVDRELYEIRVKRYKAPVMFPAPCEVDRKLYKAKNFTPSGDVIGFRPLSR